MRVALGADHAGYELKEEVRRSLDARHVAYEDFGTHSLDAVDYPVYAARVAEAVTSGACDRGILICGTGIGMAIAANRFAGIRAASISDLASARLGRAHNNINVLTLGGRLTPVDRALKIVAIFLDTPFEAGRHQHRLDLVAGFEPHATGHVGR